MQENIILNQIEELANQNKSSKHYLYTFLANVSALINQNYSNINWVGFYIQEQYDLVLGPFQGKVACSYIKYGMGVCGYALQYNKTVYVPDVHKFEGHIACDSESNSELVIPIHKGEEIFGLLDIDSPLFSRFEDDILMFQKIADLISDIITNNI